MAYDIYKLEALKTGIDFDELEAGAKEKI